MSTTHSASEFSERFPAAFAVFEQGRAKGLHLGAQVYVSYRGQVLADVGLGEAIPDVPMTADHCIHWLSAGKPLTAVLIGQLVEQGRAHWDARVAEFLPEFGNRGKERLTLRQILTHTAGLRNVDLGGPELTWDETIARLCAAPLDDGAVLGETAAYHVASTWFLLGEVIQRVTGRTFADVLQHELCQPAGMINTMAALDESATGFPGSNRGAPIAPLFERTGGALQMLDWHLPPRAKRVSPGSSLRGPIRDLGRFYEALRLCLRPPCQEGGRGGSALPASPDSKITPLNSPLAGGAKRLLATTTAHEMTARQRVGRYDDTLGHIVDFGLGFLIDSKQYGVETVPYGYGRFCSSRTFGHGGAQSSQGYCDPDHELVIAWLFNGRPGEGQHQRRTRAFNDALYRDLGMEAVLFGTTDAVPGQFGEGRI